MDLNEIDFDDEELDVIELENLEENQEELESLEESLENNLDNNENENSDVQESEEDDIITYMLKSNGISDPTKIKFEGEDGNIEEKAFDSLTREEQLNILKPVDSNKVDETSLDEAEILLINKLRSNRLSPDEYEQYIYNQGIEKQKQLSEESSQNYQIDDIEDDELFILDLQARFDKITDEEAVEALNRAKADEALYKKQIEGIREEYKRIEDDKNQRDLLEQEEKQKELFKLFSNSIQNSIQNFNTIGNLDIELDQDDKEDIAQFLLSADGAGINYFSKALNDPNTLVKMAWFALKGDDAFNNITSYFTNEIKQREQASYLKGLKDGAAKGKSSNKVVYQPKQNINNNKQNQQLPLTIYDLD